MNHDLTDASIELPRPKTENSLAEIVPLLAHRLRNPLSVIITATSQMQESGVTAPRSDDDQSYLDAIMTSAEQIEEILKRFILFACPEPPQIEPVDLNELCRIEINSRDWPSPVKADVKIEFHPDDRLPDLACDPFQIRVMLKELMDNAYQAIHASGTMTLSTGSHDRSAIITLEDNGHGISGEQSGQIFQPFYTTRPGKSGLGLAIAQSLIAAHKGTIELESRAAEGTRVRVILPGLNRIKE